MRNSLARFVPARQAPISDYCGGDTTQHRTIPSPRCLAKHYRRHRSVGIHLDGGFCPEPVIRHQRLSWAISEHRCGSLFVQIFALQSKTLVEIKTDRSDRREHNTQAVRFAVAVEPRAVARRICLTAQRVCGKDATLHGPISVGPRRGRSKTGLTRQSTAPRQSVPRQPSLKYWKLRL